MKKYSLSFLLFIFSVFCVHSQTLTLGDVEYRVDTLANFQVGPGTQYIALRLTTECATPNQNVFFLKADLRNEHIEMRHVLSNDLLAGGWERLTATARRRSAPGAFYFAGINADASVAYGVPSGGTISDSEIGRTPNTNMVFAVDELGRPDAGFMTFSGHLTFDGATHVITSVNLGRGENALVLYNRFQGATTGTNQWGTEVPVELFPDNAWGINRTLRARVIGEPERNTGNMQIPEGQAVLSGNGTSAGILNRLSVGDEIEIYLELVMNDNAWAWAQMTGGHHNMRHALMLKDGVLETELVWNSREPRSGIGFSVTRDTLILCVVDGRSGASGGVTTLDLARIMQSAGAWTAMNLDGGGSSTLFAEPLGGVVNVLSDGTERALGNSVLLVSTAPEDDNVTAIKSHTPVLKLPVHGEFIPQFLAYNQFGALLDIDLQGAVLSAPPSLGTIVGNKFIAGGSDESGIITATYNGVATEIRVVFIPALDVVLRLDSIILDDRTDYTIEAMATTARGENPISPLAFSWIVENDEIAEVVDGRIRALSNGITRVTGQLGDTIRHLTVHVEIPDVPVLIADNTELENWRMTVPEHYRADARLNKENLPPNWEHGIAVNFIHRAGQNPNIRLENSFPLFGLPDTVRLVVNTGEAAFAATSTVGLRANNESRTVVNATVSSFPENEDFSIDIAVADLFDASDRAIYPIWFDHIHFRLRAGGMTAGRAYTIAVKEIQLIYEGIQTNIPFVKDSSLPNFFIFPNPTSDGIINLQLSENNAQTVRTEIFDLQGRMVSQEFHGINSGAPLQLSIQHLPSGTYLLRVFENESSGTMQFIVK